MLTVIAGSTNSTTQFEISLWRSDEELESFNPQFTYPIFGEEEVIFGYQGLKTSLAFAAHNLRPNLQITYKQKFPDQGEVKASDIRGALQDFLPPDAFSSASRIEALADPGASSFVPPGELLHTYERDGETYQIWCAALADNKAQEILRNMQILVPLFIEGGTMLELDHSWIVDRWKLFLLYRIDDNVPPNTSMFSLAGYSTSYRVFTFPERYGNKQNADSTTLTEAEVDSVLDQWTPQKEATVTSSSQSPLELLSRERISQFLVLPPYQGAGHGAELYNVIYIQLTKATNVVELTVEDPNEAFDDMRDICDLVYLRSHVSEFADLKINCSISATALMVIKPIPIDEIVSLAVRNNTKKASKIQSRQLARLVEMQTLSRIPARSRKTARITRKEKCSDENDRAYYFWRLYVKQRLYIHNRDTLAQLEPEERIEKLEGAMEGLQGDYERLLAIAEKRMGVAPVSNGHGNGESSAGLSRVNKRPRASTGDAEEDTESAASGSRKRRALRAIVRDEDDEGEDIGDAV